MNERLLYLGKSYDIFVNDNHIFGTDAVLLSHFAKPKKSEKCLDIGTGNGIIPFLWLRDNPQLDVSAIEIQEEAYLLSKKTAEKNNFNINLVLGDIKEYEKYFSKGSFNLISCNPPYFAENDGIKATEKHRVMQRHEVSLDICSLSNAVKNLLNFGGRFCMCIRPERLFEVADAFKENSLAIKRIRFVCKNKDASPKLVLIEAKKGAKNGLVVEPNLILFENGLETAEVQEIYKEIRETK